MKEKKVKVPKEKKAKVPKVKKIKAPKINLKTVKLADSLAFKFEIAIFAILFIFFSALVFILNLTISRDSIKTYSEMNTTIVERTSAALTNTLMSYFKDIRVFTKSEAFLEGDIETAKEFMINNTQLIGGDFEYVGICGMDGNLFTSEEYEENVLSTEFYKEVIERGNPECITNPVYYDKLGKYLFYVAVPAVDKNGALFGMFVAAVPISFIQNEISSSKVGKNGFAFAIDGNGIAIVYPDSEIEMTNFSETTDEQSGMYGLDEIVKNMTFGRSGNGVINDKNTKSTNYIFYTSIYGTNWSLALSLPEKEVLESAKRNGINIAGCSIIIAILVLIFIAVYMKILLRPLLLLNLSITEIAKGDADLTKKIEIKSKDEIGGVVRGFNSFIDNLRKIIAEIKDSKTTLQDIDRNMQKTTAETGTSISQIAANIDNVIAQIDAQGSSVNETVASVTQIAKSIENLNNLIENQSNGVSQASSAVEEMLGNITSVSRSTERMADAFHQLEDYTQNGIEKQNLVNQKISLIEEQSQMLFKANKTISKIASETNLLAMNAAIEAAHAGEAGQGFSVVADEIRNLSETSAKQSKSIGAELAKIQESIQSVVESSSEAKEAFNSVSENIQQTDQLVQQIRAAMEESEAGSHQITDALKMMNDSTVEVRTSSSEMSEGNQTILNEVKRLQEATEGMKDSIQRMSSNAHQIEGNGTTLRSISTTMKKSIEQIGDQIDLFIV